MLTWSYLPNFHRNHIYKIFVSHLYGQQFLWTFCAKIVLTCLHKTIVHLQRMNKSLVNFSFLHQCTVPGKAVNYSANSWCNYCCVWGALWAFLFFYNTVVCLQLSCWCVCCELCAGHTLLCFPWAGWNVKLGRCSRVLKFEQVIIALRGGLGLALVSLWR